MARCFHSTARRTGDYKNKIAVALKEIEIQRRELEGLKGRLAERRQRLFDSTVRSLQEKNKSKANVYANEHAEIRKTIRIVEASELALTQVSLRLQSIMEVGDAMVHVGAAFKSLKTVSKTMEEFGPALDATSASINNTLTETMAQMGQISPGITVDVHTENAEELVEQAQKFAEEQAERLKTSLHVMPSRYEEEIHRTDDRIPDTRYGRRQRGRADRPRDHLRPERRPQGRGRGPEVRDLPRRCHRRLETSINLGIPQDEVEQSMIRLVAAGKVRSQRRSE